MKSLRYALHTGATAVIFALLLGMATGVRAEEKKTPPKPAANHANASHGATTHGPTTGGATTHGPTTGGVTHGPTTGGATTHGPTTGGATTHGPTTGGVTHGPTTGGATTHGPTTGGATTHGPTTGGATTHGPTTGGATTHGPTTGGATTHGPTTGGATTTHGPTTGGASGGSHLQPGNTGHIGGSPSGYGRTPNGMSVHPVRGGASFITRPGGRPAGFHDPARGIDTHHGLNGGFHGSVWHPDHSGVYFAHGRPGFVQRPYSWHGHDFGRRAYYWHGHPYYGYYHGWGWHGGFFNVYAPGFFFAPGFYGWAYNPWYHPIGWGWGWRGAPWFGFYGGWFTPYPVYASPAFWLTDYIISQDLEAAYAAHQEGGEQAVAGGNGVMLTPEVKDEIAQEVRNEIALENQEAQQTAQGQAIDPGSSGIARILADPKPHVFVVSSALDVVDAGSGQECALSDGDVIQTTAPIGPNDASANLVVLASKGGNECQRSETVTVNLTDLQEMQNAMRMTLDNGLKELQAKQGQGGLPQAPPSAQAAPTEAPYAAIAPPPDPNDAQQIQQQEQQSQQDEQQAQSQQQ